MIKPLLKIIPALSGNVKLACELTDYTQLSEDEFAAVSRIGHIFPLSNKLHTKVIDVSFLSGSWEFDISSFYNKGYSDIFYKDCFEYDKNNLLYITDINNIINDRNVDYDFGCKRASYMKTGYQLCFFAPIYCDNVDDLPDYFEIQVTLNNNEMYKVTKTIKVSLDDTYKKNYLHLYLNRYFSKIDDNVVYMLPDSVQAVYNGIDVWLGGFNQYKDNVISKVFSKETTINGFDACLADGFKRNNLIMKQVMPLAFYFNINDILTDVEKTKFQNAELYIKGQYYKNNNALSFYMFDDNYDYLSLPVLKVNQNNGKLEYKYNTNNILALSDNYAIDTTDVEEYKFSNKINKTYIRWKLKYSSNEHPYITNCNYNFSKNQDLYNLYYEYPQNYYWASMFCNYVDENINVLLPIGNNIESYYSEYKYLINKFHITLNNYVTNWFDMTDSKNISDIISNTEWGDVHSEDNKLFYKGLLYNFNDIYNSNDITNKIDKFAILFYINNSSLFTNQTASNYIYSKYNIKHSQNNNVVLNLHTINNDSSYIKASTLFNTNAITNNDMTFSINEYYTYNSYGTGNFVELEDIGCDFYEINKYYILDYIKQLPDYKRTSQDKKKIISSKSYTGFTLLPISYANNIMNSSGTILPEYLNNIYFSYNNVNVKTPIDKLDYSVSGKINEIHNSYVFYQKFTFISYFDINQYISNDKLCYLQSFIYYPKYLLDNNKYLYNIYITKDDTNKFYGNRTSQEHIGNDKDVLYVDPYNIKEKLSNYYELSGNIYVKDINDDYITLSNFDENKHIYLFTNSDSREKVCYALDIEHTYAYQEKYNYNKYNVEKVITNINSIYITYNDLYGDRVVVKSSYISTDLKTSYNTNIINEGTSIINCYSYNFDVSNKILTNNVLFKDNEYNHNSYIFGYFYVSDINTDNLSITLTNYNSDNIVINCDNETQLYKYAYEYNVLTNIDDKYIINRNGVGSYMYRKSYIFSHPQTLIKQIYNMTYISSDYEFTYSKPYIVSYNEDVNYSLYNMTVYNPSMNNIDLSFNGITWLYDNTNKTMYGKIMNYRHLVVFINYINQYALDINDKEITENSNVYDYIYIKKPKIVVDNTVINIHDIYIPLSSLFDNNYNIINNIKYVGDYLFNIDDESGLYTNVELYFKKDFIKITKQIYENVISLSTSNYKDLYIYRLEKTNDNNINVKYINDTSANTYIETYQGNSLVPLFNDVYREKKLNTVIYNSYVLNMLNQVNYIDTAGNTTYTLYRYNNNDKLCMVDVSYISDLTYNTYILRTDAEKPSFIYDTLVTNVITYSYTTNLNGTTVKVIDPDIEYITYSYCSSRIPTYDKVTNVTADYVNITDNLEIPFDKYKINTYTYNGTTYGFYLNEINLTNINSIFNITFTDFSQVKYFTYVNGKSIIDNHKYFTNVFKQLIPIMKYNILTQLYSIPVLNKQFKVQFNKEYINFTDKTDNKKHIIYDKNRIDTISLYRYYDSITPYIIETNNIYSDYALKTKTLKYVDYDSIMYNDNINIYNYPGIRIYTDKDIYTTYKQVEYKYFNDSKFINLNTEIVINIAEYLSETDVLEYQEESIIKKYFKKYINNLKNSKFTDEEVLFLYNKYKVLILTSPVKLNNNYNNKVYKLTYKFSLK